jgi:hypothetical protein
MLPWTVMMAIMSAGALAGSTVYFIMHRGIPLHWGEYTFPAQAALALALAVVMFRQVRWINRKIIQAENPESIDGGA